MFIADCLFSLHLYRFYLPNPESPIRLSFHCFLSQTFLIMSLFLTLSDCLSCPLGSVYLSLLQADGDIFDAEMQFLVIFFFTQLSHQWWVIYGNSEAYLQRKDDFFRRKKSKRNWFTFLGKRVSSRCEIRGGLTVDLNSHLFNWSQADLRLQKCMCQRALELLSRPRKTLLRVKCFW